MWEFYLAASEMSFREQNMMVMQIQLAKRQGRRPYHAGLYFARGKAARRR
jgi:cyclopropane-fatty-acyl-phospholipid synthase